MSWLHVFMLYILDFQTVPSAGKVTKRGEICPRFLTSGEGTLSSTRRMDYITL